jgi:CspA family cold shock protein
MADSGTIKWFSNAKGFGFIVNEKGNGDIFVHYSAIMTDGYKTLKAGQLVNYEIQEGEKGLHAINVIPSDQKVAAG